MITLANTQEKLEAAFPEMSAADIAQLAQLAYGKETARVRLERGFTSPETILAEWGYAPGDEPQ